MIIYNDKIELIKASEYLVGVAPHAIIFKIQESTLDESMKSLRLTSESQGQQYDLPIDLNTIPRFFETDQDLERRLRNIALTRAEDLSIVDLMKFHSPTVALSIFVKQLHEVLHIKRLDKHNVNEKMFRVLKNESKLHKFNMEI